MLLAEIAFHLPGMWAKKACCQLGREAVEVLQLPYMWAKKACCQLGREAVEVFHLLGM